MVDGGMLSVTLSVGIAKMDDENEDLPRINWDESFKASRRIVRRKWGWRLAAVSAVGVYGLWAANWGIVAASVAAMLLGIRRYVAEVQLVRMITSEEFFDTEKFRQLSRETMRQNSETQ